MASTARRMVSDDRARIAALEAEIARLKAGAAPPDAAPQRRHRDKSRLSNRRIETLKAPGFYSDGDNLYLDFKEPPSKNWVFRYKRGGRARDMGLGPWPLVGLAEAREQAIEARRKLRAGIDPIDEKKAARLALKLERAKVMTFKQGAEAYIAAHEAGWKNAKHAAQWPSTLQAYAYPVFGALPVSAVDTALVMKALQPIWGTKTETASRLRGRIESVLDWARTSGYRTGENPARWKGHLENLLAAKAKIARVEHHAALPYLELPAFIAELDRQDGLGALALKFTILTCTRTGEAIGAKWEEINLDERIWTIPAERMKAGREHRIPLSPPAIAILKTLKELPPSPFLFPANRRRPVSNMIMLMTLRRMGRGALTTHGFRSTFSDWCAERTNFASELREMALAHTVGNKVEAAYRRGDLFDKRRRLMEAWAKFATGPAAAGQVVPLVAAAG